MASQSPSEEELRFLMCESDQLNVENSNNEELSFAKIDPSKYEEHLSSNILASSPTNIYEELCQKYDKNRRSRGSAGSSSCGSLDGALNSRRKYASLDVGSMGVDVSRGPLTRLDNIFFDESDNIGAFDTPEKVAYRNSREDIESEKLVESITEKILKEIDKNVVVRRRQKIQAPLTALPPGWEKHSDEDGFYYWHIKSGTIQREVPEWDSEAHQKNMCDIVRNVRSSNVFDENFDPTLHPFMMAKGSISSVESLKDKDGEVRKTSCPSATNNFKEHESSESTRVQVHSLGWIELSEEMLTSENSSQSVNRCIVQLTSNACSVSSAELWGGGKELILELCDGSLRLFDEDNGRLLNSQPIHTIRVWGVGRDNSHDFAYVAKDKQTRKHLCHVFRCDTQARYLANALRDVCKKILIERSLVQSSSKMSGALINPANDIVDQKISSAKPNDPNDTGRLQDHSRPSNLVNCEKLSTRTVPVTELFPSPMEESKKTTKAKMLGTTMVNKPCGMDVLNDSISSLIDEVPQKNWKNVCVAVAPSTITISFEGSEDAPLDCRVRFLSFLGISKQSANFCAFIVHTPQDTFKSYVFYCEPNAGQLCKTIETACKLRYQKCIDARQPNIPGPEPQACANNKNETVNKRTSIGAAILGIFAGTIGGRRH